MTDIPFTFISARIISTFLGTNKSSVSDVCFMAYPNLISLAFFYLHFRIWHFRLVRTGFKNKNPDWIDITHLEDSNDFLKETYFATLSLFQSTSYKKVIMSQTFTRGPSCLEITPHLCGNDLFSSIRVNVGELTRDAEISSFMRKPFFQTNDAFSSVYKTFYNVRGSSWVSCWPL